MFDVRMAVPQGGVGVSAHDRLPGVGQVAGKAGVEQQQREGATVHSDRVALRAVSQERSGNVGSGSDGADRLTHFSSNYCPSLPDVSTQLYQIKGSWAYPAQDNAAKGNWPMNASLHVLAPEILTAAIKEAARRDLTTSSEYIRRALIERLRNDGV